tara:strand:- start:3788 stop:4459 length:672 start_codon:yes stop_codon:yes gene_type:complete
MTLELFNYPYSVYGRIVRIVLDEKKLSYDVREINPFAADMPESYRAIHPFARVPALRHDEFTLYETSAITAYLDERFEPPSLQPATSDGRGRMRQIIAIADNYAYIPLVRQVFSHRVFRPAFGETADEAEVRAGLDAAPRILRALDDLVTADAYATGPIFSLADAHLGAMMDYFTMAQEGAEMLTRYPNLNGWWARIKSRPSLLLTRPELKSRLTPDNNSPHL